MKVESYFVGNPTPERKRPAIWAHGGTTLAPLVYLQRPAWVRDDQTWAEIVKAVRIELPQGFEIGEDDNEAT